MKASSKSSAAGVVERGLELAVGRCGCQEAKGFWYHEPDTLSTNGKKEGKRKKEWRREREEEENGEKEKETERRGPWPEEEELTVLGL